MQAKKLGGEKKFLRVCNKNMFWKAGKINLGGIVAPFGRVE